MPIIPKDIPLKTVLWKRCEITVNKNGTGTAGLIYSEVA
jgi:hypothetical protein